MQLRAFLHCLILLPLCAPAATYCAGPVRVASPDGAVVLTLAGGNSLQYMVDFHGKRLLNESPLGLKLEGQNALGPGMESVRTETSRTDESYTLPVGKTRTVRDHYNAARVSLKDAAGRELAMELRVYDDGVAFRYVLPKQPGLETARIERELTEFHYSRDAVLYPIILEGFQSSYEDEYQLRQVSGLHGDWLIGLPLLAEVPGVGWAAITEADIENYAGMYVRKAQAQFGVRAELAPRLDRPVAVEAETPLTTPWRVVMVGDEPGRLIESNIVLNLNPPSRIADTGWIKAGKSAWDWWAGDTATGVSFKPGMNTETMEHYIDFASEAGLPYMLIDAGWATPAPGKPESEAHADITHPVLDMPELLRHAREKHVRLWLWSHWTSVDEHMDAAFPLFEQWGIAGVKIDFMNRDDQQMTAWYRRVAERAAEHHLMVDFHGAFKPDGMRRTFPNVMTREGVMGKEYLKVSGRTTPLHDVTLPFTRMLAGPLDYTPGAFGNVTRAEFEPHDVAPVCMNTRAHELALYVVLESPLQMVSDYPERYKGQRDFAFIQRVPTTWDEVRVLSGLPMESIVMARRSGEDWYVGALTNWDARTAQAPLSFLGDGKYVAEIYADAADATMAPTHTVLTRQVVDRTTVLELKMVSGGGAAIWIHRADAH